jgi:Methyltransferase domain
MKLLKATIRRVLPQSVARTYHAYRQWQLSRQNRRMTTEDVFTGIYANNRWGGQPGTFNSGSGSHSASIVVPYIAAVTGELDRMGGAALTVVDLGCGDYSVGRQLSSACGRYIGVDIVKPLIAHNQAAYGTSRVSFQYANIVEDDIPDGDICFVRQVFQHLSNAQIAAVLPKLDKFRCCFITEHQPSAGRLLRANADKTQGGNIRVSAGSGVFLDQPPFNVPADRYRALLEVPGMEYINGADPGVIRTYLLAGYKSDWWDGWDSNPGPKP